MEILEQYVKPFVNVTLNTFKAFVGFELSVGNPHFSGRSLKFDQDISAVIGLSGGIRGAVVIAMKKSFALRVTNSLTGTEHTELDDDVVDALGEIVNIIAGNIKNEVPGGETITSSLPTVIKGSGHSFAWPGRQSRILCVSFKHEHEKEIFYLLVDIDKVK
jgi:chemotaxis protein CheX